MESLPLKIGFELLKKSYKTQHCFYVTHLSAFIYVAAVVNSACFKMAGIRVQ